MNPSDRQFRVALVIDFSERFDRSVLDGISSFVRQANNWRIYVPHDPQHRVSMLRNWNGDGIIANFDDPDVVEVVRKKRVVAVGFGGGEGYMSKRIHYMTTDNAGIGELGALHLMQRGLMHFGYCGMSQVRRNQPWSEERGEAFRATVEAHGFDCSMFCTTRTVESNWKELLRAMCEWLQELPRPCGVMAAYDLHALHLLEACHELRVRVPDEIAVLGVDNDEQACELSAPPLSSIEQGGERLGSKAAQLLDQLMSGGKMPTRVETTVPPVGVISRQSTDVLAIEDQDVALAIRYIRNSACDGIQVGDVMKLVHVSRVSFENRFKAVVGHTMHVEIKRVQLDKVRELLRTTDLSIRQIAERTGFEYPQYLSNLFQKTFHQTLGEFRKQVRSVRHARGQQGSDGLSGGDKSIKK
jgi:LacI family transcriptional regulator